MDVCDRENSALSIAHYRKFILTKFYTVKQTHVCLLLLNDIGMVKLAPIVAFIKPKSWAVDKLRAG